MADLEAKMTHVLSMMGYRQEKLDLLMVKGDKTQEKKAQVPLADSSTNAKWRMRGIYLSAVAPYNPLRTRPIGWLGIRRNRL